MPAFSTRIAARVGPGVALGDEVGELIDRCAGDGSSEAIDRCLEQLDAIGRMGIFLADDPRTRRSLADDDTAVRAHPAVLALARWMDTGAPGPLRLRVSPLVVRVVRAKPPAVLKVVGFRKPVAARARSRDPVRESLDPDRAAGNDDLEVVRLILDIAHAPVAAAVGKAVAHPERRCVLHHLIVAIYLAVARVGTISQHGMTSPGLHEPVMRAVVAALSAPGRLPLVRVTSCGFEVAFELTAHVESGMPFRIVEIRDLEADHVAIRGRGP